MIQASPNDDAVGAELRRVDAVRRSTSGHVAAAAPQLYDAGKAVLRVTGRSARWNGETHQVLVQLEEAIAMAEGVAS